MRRLLIITTLIAALAPLPTAAAPDPIRISIDLTADRRPISPYIYGMNFPNEQLVRELRLTVQRWGGNAVTRYNWQANVGNTGSDYFFQNVPSSNADQSKLPTGSASDTFVSDGKARGVQSILTLPMTGWVAKADSSRTHPYACSFSIKKYGSQTASDPWDPDCGSGTRPDGSLITADPRDTSQPADEGFSRAWVEHLVKRFGRANQGGVRFYALDNEPGIWETTHRDIRPNAATYAELRDKAISYARAVKQADPSAQILGPVQDGWTRFIYASYPDQASAQADQLRNGGEWFVPWYLGQLRAEEQRTGTRLLDYLDLHYYPQAPNVTLTTAGDAATQALRLRSTRTLWDPSYIDESWITSTLPAGQSVRLIPRMREWVAQRYPDTKLALTEYNWGGLEHINGALAQADILGIFGREGVDLATLWAPPEPNQPGAYAFRMYRNYDGRGGSFGDIATRAKSADQDKVASYAATRSDGALTIMLINKTTTDQPLNIALANAANVRSGAVYRYSNANPTAITRPGDVTASNGTIVTTLPRESITLMVFANAQNLTKRAYIPATRR